MRWSLNELMPIFSTVALVVIVIALMLTGESLPGSADWGTINTHLIMSLPFILLIFVGAFVVATTTGPFVIAGAGLVGVSFSLLLDYLVGVGVVDPSKSIGALFGGSLNTVIIVIIIGSLILGSVLSVVKRK